MNPRDFYSIELPADWEKTFDGDTLVVFSGTGRYADVSIFSTYAEFGWKEGYTLNDGALFDLNLKEDEPGFEIVSLWSVSATAKRSEYVYDGQGDFCDTEGFGLHILLKNRDFFVRVEVCENATWKYDEAFVERVFAGFSYANK